MNHNGYISAVLCGPDGRFEDPPQLILTFPAPYEGVLPGVTITWSPTYGEWAVEYRVLAYQGERILFSQTETNSGLTSVLAGDISGYDRLVVEVLAWSQPQHRARAEGLFLGVEKVYGKSQIMDFSASMSVNPLSAELPKSEVRFSILNLDGEYNPDNPQGMSKYLMERQEITVRYGYKLEGAVEWIPGGTYYLSEWDNPQNGITASFTARDGLEFLTEPYGGPQSGTLYDIASAAFRQADLAPLPDGSPRWLVDESLRSIPAPDLKEELSKESLAVVLQYAANAACCVFYQDRTGRIRIEPLNAQLEDYSIDRFVSYANAELTLTKPLRSVDVNNGQFVFTAGRKGEVQSLSNPLLTEEQAPAAARWTADYLQNRRVLSGSYRADPRLDPLDLVRLENQFAQSIVLITNVEYTYNGAFRGSYTSRGMMTAMAQYYYAGDLYAGEV